MASNSLSHPLIVKWSEVSATVWQPIKESPALGLGLYLLGVQDDGTEP